MTPAVSRYLSGLTDPSPDCELLRRYAECRDPDAFAGLVRRFGPLVLGVCHRALGDGPDADDAFQATFLVLARRAGRVRQGVALPAWLHRVAVRTAGKARARRRPTAPLPDLPAAADPFADVAWRDVRRVVDDELDRLPERYRGPVVLCLLDGLTRDEAARRLGYSLSTLKRRLEAGRELLRCRLTRRGLGTVAVAVGVLSAGGLRAGVPDALTAAAAGLAAPDPAVSPSVAALADAAGRAAGRLLARAGAAAFALAVAAGVLAAVGPPDLPADPPRVATAPEGQPAAAGKKPADPPGFVVRPVRTDLQRELLPGNPTVFALVDPTPADGESLAVRRLPLKDLRAALAPHVKNDAAAHVRLVFPRRLAGDAEQAETLRYAVLGFTYETGFPRGVTAAVTYLNDDTGWVEHTAPFAAEEGPADAKEPAAGAGPVQVYPVATQLSRYLTDGADCVVVVVPSLEKGGGVVPQAVRDAATGLVARVRPPGKKMVSFVLAHVETDDKQRLIEELRQFGTGLGFEASAVTFR
jgi:RNA polymerase sigma factor (sigma-70 family)